MGPTSKTTPSPPASSTTATVVQKLTLSITAAQYTGNVKTVMETAVGIVYKIFVNNAWLTNCAVKSKVSSRRAVIVEFTATMPAAQGAAANTAAKGLTVTKLATAATQAKSALGASYANTTIPTVSNIQAASCTGICATFAGVAGTSMGVSTMLIAIAFGFLTILQQ